jgi:hypothetical protein
VLALASACGQEFDLDVLAAALDDTERAVDGLRQPPAASRLVRMRRLM